MKKILSILFLTLAMVAGAASADPLSGKWVLNVGRTHYGGGAVPRKEETFTCEADKQLLRCTIKSTRVDGKQLLGIFAAAYDGKPYAVTGIPDVDSVRLQRVDDHVADATFTGNGRPVLAYRAVKSDDGRSLAIVSVDPISHSVLNSVVIYDRR